MKLLIRGLLILGLLISVSVGAVAQSNPQPLTQYCVLTATGFCPAVGLQSLKQGVDTHNVYINPVGTPGSITVLIQGSVIGDFTDAVTCGTSSTTTSNLLSCSGIYAAVRVRLSVFSGFTSVGLFYVGTSSVGKNGGGGSGGSFPTGTTGQTLYNTGTGGGKTYAATSGVLYDGSGNLLIWNAKSPYNGANRILGKVTTAEGQAVSTDFNFSETEGVQGGACPAGGSGVVNTSGTGVTWVSGTAFPTGSLGVSANWIGQWITVNGVQHQIASVTNNHALVLTETAGTQTGVAYSVGLGFTDTVDPVLGLAWNGVSGEGFEVPAYGFNWGAWFENNWCAGGGDASNEGYIQANIPDGAGGTFQYRPFFMDVFKTANGAGSTHVGFTHMNLVADNYTLGSITNLAAHTVTNYLQGSPTLFNVGSAATDLSGLTTINNNGASTGGLLWGAGNTQGGTGATNQFQILNSGVSGTCPTLSFYTLFADGLKIWQCPEGSSGTAFKVLGTDAVQANGLNAISGPLTAPWAFFPSGSNSGLSVALTGTTSFSGWYVTSNGINGTTAYNYLGNRGGGSTLTDGKVGTDSGVTLHIADGNTDIIVGNGSGGSPSFPTAGGLAGQAMCWKTNTTLSYCTSVVGAGGACTCH